MFQTDFANGHFLKFPQGVQNLKLLYKDVTVHDRRKTSSKKTASVIIVET